MRIANSIVWHNRTFYFGAVHAIAGPCGIVPDSDPGPAGTSSARSRSRRGPTGISACSAGRAVQPGVVGAVGPDRSEQLGELPGGHQQRQLRASNSSTTPAFVSFYFNTDRRHAYQIGETNGEATLISTPAALDEGGNFIRPQFGPLSLENPDSMPPNQPFGNYHVTAGVGGANLATGADALYTGVATCRTRSRPTSTARRVRRSHRTEARIRRGFGCAAADADLDQPRQRGAGRDQPRGDPHRHQPERGNGRDRVRHRRHLQRHRVDRHPRSPRAAPSRRGATTGARARQRDHAERNEQHRDVHGDCAAARTVIVHLERTCRTLSPYLGTVSFGNINLSGATVTSNASRLTIGGGHRGRRYHGLRDGAVIGPAATLGARTDSVSDAGGTSNALTFTVTAPPRLGTDAGVDQPDVLPPSRSGAPAFP